MSDVCRAMHMMVYPWSKLDVSTFRRFCMDYIHVEHIWSRLYILNTMHPICLHLVHTCHSLVLKVQ